MYSKEERVIYPRNQLAEVICQLRFPRILSIGSKPPADFQEAVRGDYPQYSTRQEFSAPAAVPGKPVQKPEPITNYQFVSSDGRWKINLTEKFISLSCSSYTCWEDFARRLDKPLAAFIQIYKPACFERVGLRYVNFISRRALELQGEPFCALISPKYLGILADPQVNEAAAIRSTVDADLAVGGGCRAKLHAGPGMVRRGGERDSEVKFILDMDLYMPGSVEVRYAAGALQTLHAQAFPIFRDAITDRLSDAMERSE